MSVAVDTGSPANFNLTGGSSASGTVTTAGSDNLLVVTIFAYTGQVYGAVADIVTFNSVSMTYGGSANWPTPTGQIFASEVWYLQNPPIGAYTLTLTPNSGCCGNGSNWNGGAVQAIAFTGANSVGVIQSANSASATSVSVASLSGTNGASDLYLAFGVSNPNGPLVSGSNMTNYINGHPATGWYTSLDTIASSQPGNAATYTQASSADDMFIGVIPILAPIGTAIGWVT